MQTRKDHFSWQQPLKIGGALQNIWEVKENRLGEYSNTHGYTIEYDLYSYGCTDHHQLKIWTKKLKSKLHLRQWEEDQMSFPLDKSFP